MPIIWKSWQFQPPGVFRDCPDRCRVSFTLERVQENFENLIRCAGFKKKFKTGLSETTNLNFSKLRIYSLNPFLLCCVILILTSLFITNYIVTNIENKYIEKMLYIVTTK
jgi:hypothetical protein